MILQTGMRTDIPAFYSQWFLNRLKAGYVLVRNPYNQTQVSKILINPEVVDLIGFCTKNPAPLLPYLGLMKNYGQYWFVTITPYGTDIEQNVPPYEEVIESFKKLSAALGKNCVAWRYDPILLNKKYTIDFHIQAFRKMAESLKGYTDTCVISFIDIYEKFQKLYPDAKELSDDEKITLGKEIIKTGKENGFTIKTCAEGNILEPYGADCRGCSTIEIYEKALGCTLEVPGNAPHQRKEKCTCTFGTDIGAYNTCLHMCRYCYANGSPDLIRTNFNYHNPNSPLLTGNLMPGDKIHQLEQKSWKSAQGEFEF